MSVSEWGYESLGNLKLLRNCFDPMSSPIPEIGVEALGSHLADRSEEVQFIDVREPQELEIACLPGFENLPLSQFSEWSGVIHQHFNPAAETLVLCHHGMRSAQMCQWLISQGFTNVKNVRGGIDAYAVLVDPAVPRY
jgi:rhodanese-related sulfurtransferase